MAILHQTSLSLLYYLLKMALFNNNNVLTFNDIYEAIKSSKAVYPDVIKKELVVFKEKFKKELEEEGVNVIIPE